jgi:hypothetical protein
MVTNILENIEYVEPDTSLPVPDGMCKDCIPNTTETLPPVIDEEKI